MHSRLQQLFGAASPFLLHPQRSALACVVAWLLSLPLTWQHPWLALLAFSAIWGLTLAIRLEEPWLQFHPLPPLTVLLIGLCMRWGLGPLLLAVGGSGGNPFVDIWIRYGLPAQVLWLCFTVSLLLLALPMRSVIARAASSQPQSLLLFQAINQSRLRSQLTALAILLSTYMACYIILSVLSGAFDRQFDGYINWTQQLWRLDTPVAAFSRLRDLWFLLFPLWWRLLSKPWWRCLLGAEIFVFFGIAIANGSRGLLFYPALLLLFGLWFVIDNPRILRRLAATLILFILFLSPILYVVRDSPEYQRAQGWSGRLQAFGIALSQPKLIEEKARWIGRDLYACHDPFLFKPENRKQPPVSFRGLDSLLYIWVPKHLYPDRPVIFDGHLIAKQLQRVPQSEFSDVWFPCFSLPADLMRRWALPGVFVGSFLVAGLIHFLLRLWYKNAKISGSTFNMLLYLLPATYLQSFPFGTVSETCWAFFWELPKYIALFWLIGSGVDRYLRKHANGKRITSL